MEFHHTDPAPCVPQHQHRTVEVLRVKPAGRRSQAMARSIGAWSLHPRLYCLKSSSKGTVHLLKVYSSPVVHADDAVREAHHDDLPLEGS